MIPEGGAAEAVNRRNGPERWDGLDPEPKALSQENLEEVKALIAEVVLEFYGDLDFLPKTKEGLLRHYQETGYLQDLDRHALEYGIGQGRFLVLRREGQLIGCGGIRRLDGADGELVRLWLKREARGQGYGKPLMLDLLAAAAELGFRDLYLDTSARCSAAIRIFARNGFEPCPPYKESIGEVFMRRRMKP